MHSLVKENLKKIDDLEKERIFWLKISAFVVFISTLMIFNWKYFVQAELIFTVTSIGIFITIIWWYWTMNIIKKLIQIKLSETLLLDELTSTTKDIKEKIIKNIPRSS